MPDRFQVVRGASISLTGAGLTGTEEFTIVVADCAGNVSAPSDGMVPARPVSGALAGVRCAR